MVTCHVNYKGSGVPTHAPTCTLNPSTVNVTNGATGSTTLTITTGPQNALLDYLGEGSGIAVAGLLMFFPAKRRRRWRGALLILLCTAILGFAAGCSGSSPSPSNSNTGTTSGSYTVTLTAVAGSTTSSTDVPFTVQ
jgi:hypothetical protein